MNTTIMIRNLLWNFLNVTALAPIVAITASWVISIYFRAKYENTMKIVKLFSEASGKMLEAATKLKDIRKEIK